MTVSEELKNGELSGTDSQTPPHKIFPTSFGCVPLEEGGYWFRWFNDMVATEVLIPEGITKIDNGAFLHCNRIETVSIPEGVRAIEPRTFEKHYSLKRIELPASLTWIGEDAFNYCSGLADVFYHGEKEQWEKISIGKGNGSLTLARISFLGSALAKDDSSEVIDIKQILSDSFKYYDISNIDGEAFVDEYLKDEASVVIPEGINSINYDTFKNKTSLSVIYVPGSLKEIKKDAFYGCKNLSEVIYRGDSRAFQNIDIGEGNEYFARYAKRRYVDKPLNARELGLLPFEYEELRDGGVRITKNKIKHCASATIPTEVTEIGDRAFHYSSELKQVYLPKTLKKIGEFVFSNCPKLVEITLPKSTLSIGEGAFANSGLIEIKLHEGTTRIEKMTFAHSGLSSITLPESLLSIDEEAFEKCKSLKNVYYAGTKKQWKAIKIKRKGNKPLLKAKIHFERKE